MVSVVLQPLKLAEHSFEILRSHIIYSQLKLIVNELENRLINILGLKVVHETHKELLNSFVANEQKVILLFHEGHQSIASSALLLAVFVNHAPKWLPLLDVAFESS